MQTTTRSTNCARISKQRLKILLFLTLFLGNFALQAQNMSNYITINTQKNVEIRLKIGSNAPNTPIKIVSGDKEYPLTIGVGYEPSAYYETGCDSMVIYGDITYFNCINNQAKVTGFDFSHNDELLSINCINNHISALDVSNCTKLQGLYCAKNKFTVRSLDLLYCSLPDKNGGDPVYLEPIDDVNDNLDTVLASNKQNALSKNWLVCYYSDDTEVPETEGNYDCSSASDDIALSMVSIYPNPVDEILFVNANSENITVEIFGSNGQIISKTTNKTELNVKNLPTGTYITKIHTPKGVFTKKFIKL